MNGGGGVGVHKEEVGGGDKGGCVKLLVEQRGGKW